MKHLHNTDTGKTKPLGASFKERTPIKPPFYLLSEVRVERPLPLPGHSVARAEPAIDIEARTYTLGWTQVKLPPVDPETLIPMSVTPRQMRLALLGMGITPAMIAANLAGNDAALIEWEYSLEILRSHPLVSSMAAALGMDDAAVKALFTSASQL